MPNPYVDLFRHPGAAAFSLTGVVARLPISMVGIGIVLVVKQASGSYALAGAVAATAGIAFALISPQLSRLVDRFGQRRVTTPQLVVFASGLVGIVVLAEHDAPSWTLFVAAVVAGRRADDRLPRPVALVVDRWTAVPPCGRRTPGSRCSTRSSSWSAHRP